MPDAHFATPPAPWGRIVLAEEPSSATFGPARLWMRRRHGEIQLAQTSADAHDDRPPPDDRPTRDDRPPPDDLRWSRWAAPGHDGTLVLRPTFPDRPLVVQPERPFRLVPGADALIYVRVPLRVRVELEVSGGSVLLDEFPSVALSDTWWGDFMAGELAYWLTTTARREMRPDLFAPHLAACPLRLVNRANVDLEVAKLALRVAHLSLFADGPHLWGDESDVLYEGEAEGSEVTTTGRAPEEARGARLVAPPRTPIEPGFRVRTFHRLLSIPGMGGIT